MSGGDPPLPPSRPPYHSWHGRPSHRRRGGPPGTARNGWVGRRPRSPPLPPPRSRHLRPSYKHHRLIPQTPPLPSQSQHHSTGYHPHGPPPPLSRSLQGRLRSPPRSPLRHSDLPTHRVESQPYRGEPGPSHRVEPPDHLSFRGPDPPPFRAPPLKSRGDSFSFSSERPSLRGPSDHPPPYRGEPGPLYRADSVPHRDEFEPRRGLGGIGGGGGGGDGLSNRPDTSEYGSWFRQPGKIHKTLKHKKRRPPPHMVNALRAAGPYLPKPQSPILSRIGLPVGDRGTSGSRIGMGSTPGSMRKGPGPGLSSPKLSQDLSSTSSRSNTHDPYVFGAAKQRRSMTSPRQQQSLRSISSPDERTNNDRQKLQPNGPTRTEAEKQEKVLPNGTEKRPRAALPPNSAEEKFLKEKPTSDDTAVCNGKGWSHANGPVHTSAKKNAENDSKLSSVSPSGAVSSATATEVIAREANGLKLDVLSKNDVEAKSFEMKGVSKAENGPSVAKKEVVPASHSTVLPKVTPKSPVLQVPPSSPDDMKTALRSSDSVVKEEQLAPDHPPSIPQFSKELVVSSTKTSPPRLQSEEASPASKPEENSESAPKPKAELQSDSQLSLAPLKELSSAPPRLSIPETPVPVPAPAMSLLRSTPRSRTRSSSFEGKLGSLNSFRQLSSSLPAPSTTTDFLRRSSTKTGVASADLVKHIHDVEGKITAIERTIAELKSAPPKKLTILDSPSQQDKVEESDAERYARIAREIVANAEKHLPAKPEKRSRHPLHDEGRLLLVRNQAIAAASHAELRTLCSDAEMGLAGLKQTAKCIERAVSPKVRSRMEEYLKNERAANVTKRRKLGREYATLMNSWRESLSAEREKMTKEKRDALRERDRYILLCTKGTSALLTSRTSSGRTSTKIVPSVGANGQTNGTAELDQLLNDIETEGGTPGSKLIWSKTLAEIPNQDASRYPPDCCSVLMTDPVAEHHASRAVNPWRFEEVLVFLDKYLTCSKNFIKIASFLEHKSPRDCSYFYYLNKLRLGLKQLTKDASAMKRKGILRRHLVQIAKQFAFLDPMEHSTGSYHVSVQNAVTERAAEKFMISGDVRGGSFVGMSIIRHGYNMERRDFRDLPLKRSERILHDVKAVDLTGIDRRPFAQAMAAHGTDWKAIASYLGLPGKSSTHYREFFRRNKRKLESEDIREHNRARILLPSRGSNSGAKFSPRISPRSSPRHSGHGNRSKVSDTLEAESTELMQLDDTDNDEIATRIVLKDDKETVEQRVREEISRAKHEGDGPSRATRKSEREGRKGKPTATWTADECVQFRILFRQHGRDWKAIARLMPPKTATQIKGYWRTVAHEVGDGLTVDGTRSRSERKRMKRRTSSETLSRQSPNASESDLRASSKIKFPILKDHEEEVNELNGPDLLGREALKDVGEGESEGRKDMTMTGSKKTVSSSKSDSGPQDGTPTEVATSEERPDMSKSRLPLLRSLPMPLLRSVPISSGKSKMECGSAETKGLNTTNEEEFRKAAESYGVLELLGNQLHDSADGDGKQR